VIVSTAHETGQRVALLVALLVAPLALQCLTAVPGSARQLVAIMDSARNDWRVLLDRAARATRTTAFSGEVIWITWFDDQARVYRSSVRNDPHGELVLRSADGKILRIGPGSAGLFDDDASWFLAVPMDAADSHDAFAALEAKYTVGISSAEPIMDRSCALVEIHRRSDASLRERLWIDEETGLLLRRETYDGGRDPVRLTAYLSLDLNPSDDAVRAVEHAPTELRRQHAVQVGLQHLQELREAGWAVPERLPGGYQPVTIHALSSDESHPLQIMYSDGLYNVSVFQQPGSVDWASLPPGAQRVADLGWVVYHWPGTVLAAYVWEAGGRMYAVVGDIPAGELRAIAQALPRPQPPSLGRRLVRGLARLWSWVSPWQ
jgi:hypothetical protein